jgi:DNA-binding MarR family transcriptional regulator
MTLEKDIRQTRFRDDYQKAFLNLLVTSYHFTNQLNEFFKTYDITRQQYNVLRILRGQHPSPATVQLIRERMIDKMSDASRIVERLRIKGYLNREGSSSDKRTVRVTITQKGLDLLQSIDPGIIALEKPFRTLRTEEISVFNSLLERIRDNESIGSSLE